MCVCVCVCVCVCECKYLPSSYVIEGQVRTRKTESENLQSGFGLQKCILNTGFWFCSCVYYPMAPKRVGLSRIKGFRIRTIIFEAGRLELFVRLVKHNLPFICPLTPSVFIKPPTLSIYLSTGYLKKSDIIWDVWGVSEKSISFWNLIT